MTSFVTITHSTCGRAAFLYNHRPIAGEKIESKHAFDLEGKSLHMQRLYTCLSCGRALSGMHLEPGPPILRTFDMSSPADMKEFYEAAGTEHLEGIA